MSGRVVGIGDLRLYNYRTAMPSEIIGFYSGHCRVVQRFSVRPGRGREESGEGLKGGYISTQQRGIATYITGNGTSWLGIWCGVLGDRSVSMAERNVRVLLKELLDTV